MACYTAEVDEQPYDNERQFAYTAEFKVEAYARFCRLSAVG